jgi:hypothetical protein
MMVAIERFLGKHLGGRVQETVAPDIAAKLAAITVDVSTVKLTPRPTLAYPAPVFNPAALKAGTFKYKVSGTVQGKPVEGSSELVLAKGKKAGEGWTATSTDKLPMGEAWERFTLDPKSLYPTARAIKQGPADIQLTYGPAGVTGLIKVGGQQLPVDVKSERPLAAESAQLGLLLGTLPLAPGYKATVGSFDLQGGKASADVLEVKGEEKVTVAAGTFEAWKVDVAQTSYWVEKAGAHRLLKLTSTLPQGMGSLSQELQK